MNERTLVIDVLWRPRKPWRAVRLLRRVADYVLRAEGFGRGRLSVVVVGAAAMATLNRRYLGRAGPTDVLSFDLGSERRAGRVDGEIYVCTDVARRRARARGGSLQAARAELALYVVHGILHLAGYDDQEPAGYRRMHAREDELLSGFGLGPVFREGS
jgi:probable rRNA maturation factor